MASHDNKILFTALGFLAVVFKDLPADRQALRAKSMACSIEAFCDEVEAEAAAEKEQRQYSHPVITRQLLESYIAELRDTGSASLNYDRTTLLNMYEVLLVQKIWHEQQEFFANGHEDLIASRILQLAEERIQREAKA